MQVEVVPAAVESGLGRKAAIWLACKEKTCCYQAVVIPSGRDVWRIARTLDTPPWSFLVYFDAPPARADAFALDHSGRRFRLALAKKPSTRKSAGRAGDGDGDQSDRTRRRTKPPACIFLLRTRRGFHRCGLGDLRPGVCKSFPVDLVDGVVCVQPNNGCTCREWTLADVDIAAERAMVGANRADGEEYHTVVARWNGGVVAAPPGAAFDFLDFCDFLLAAYDEIAAGAPARTTDGPPGGATAVARRSS